MFDYNNIIIIIHSSQKIMNTIKTVTSVRHENYCLYLFTVSVCCDCIIVEIGIGLIPLCNHLLVREI